MFKKAQEHLQPGTIKDAPAVDIENRWSSTYLMIRKSYDLKAAFESVCNNDRANDGVKDNNLSNAGWEQLQQIAEFLKVSAEITEMSSSNTNATICIQYIIFQLLENIVLIILRDRH